MRYVPLLMLTCLLVHGHASGQAAEQLTRQLGGQNGAARARTLAMWTDALRQDQPEEALTHGEEALSLFARHPDPEWEVRTLNEMAWAHMTLSDYANAVAFAHKGRDLAERHHDQSGRARAVNNLGSIGLIHHAQGGEAEARRHLTEALQMAIAVGDRSIVALARLGLAVVDRERGAPQRSIAHAREALTITEELQNLELTRRALEQLSASQEMAHDYAGALTTFRRFHDINARIFNEERARRLEHLDRKYQAEHREAELAELRAEQVRRVSEQAIVRNTVLAGAGAVGFAGFALYRRRVESARLAERLSVTDTLTGLKNRRFVLQTIEADVSAAARKYRGCEQLPPANADLLFMLIDVDDFKAVNDRYGHAAGDLVLRQIADVLRATCRTSDTIARWGGEEFLAILKTCDRNTAPISAERIRMAIEQHVFDIGGGQKVGITSSVGFASFPFFPERPDEVTWEQVIALADEALYRAKQAGRNTWAGPDPAALAAPAPRSASAVPPAWHGQHAQFDA